MNVSQAAEFAVKAALKDPRGLSESDMHLLAGLSGDDLLRAKAQLMLHKQQETVAFVTKLIKSDFVIQILNNLR
jgi:hypothetical protein